MTIFKRLHRHLDPVDSMGEMIFGLIMVLTFTIGAALWGGDEPLDAGELLVAAIGCNLAWGIIDAFLYLLGCVYERRRIAGIINKLASSSHDENRDQAGQLLRAELSGDLPELADPGAREMYHASIVAGARRQTPQGTRFTTEDIRGAALVFCLVLATALPAALPFLFIEDGYIALRISNALLIACLFIVGYYWGKHIGAVAWQTGTLIMSIGVVLVLVAIPLGG